MSGQYFVPSCASERGRCYILKLKLGQCEEEWKYGLRRKRSDGAALIGLSTGSSFRSGSGPGSGRGGINCSVPSTAGGFFVRSSRPLVTAHFIPPLISCCGILRNTDRVSITSYVVHHQCWKKTRHRRLALADRNLAEEMCHHFRQSLCLHHRADCKKVIGLRAWNVMTLSEELLGCYVHCFRRRSSGCDLRSSDNGHCPRLEAEHRFYDPRAVLHVMYSTCIAFCYENKDRSMGLF